MHEIIVAMNVVDVARYARYRAAITPLLEAAGGSFGYDLEVSRVLKTPGGEAGHGGHPITRVFTMRFASRAAREAFFADERYLRAKAADFVAAVDGFTVLAEIDR